MFYFKYMLKPTMNFDTHETILFCLCLSEEELSQWTQWLEDALMADSQASVQASSGIADVSAGHEDRDDVAVAPDDSSEELH